MHKEDEVRRATLEYFCNDELATAVWMSKYALRDSSGMFLEKTPTDMHKRLAKEFARIEKKYPNPLTEGEIFRMLDRFMRIVPQGSPMSGIGNDYQITSLSNCFTVDSPYDSYASICKTDQELVHLLRRRAGVGIDISHLRPKGMSTKNAAKTSSGIATFMERYSNTTREVATEGRRGALILTIDVRHPELETFINIKRDKKKVTGANISIRINDEFVKAVKEDLDFELFWPVDAKTDEEKKVRRVVKARYIFDMMMESNWESGEPGILHWDNILRESPADCYNEEGYRTICVNPCGELPLSGNDSCRLLLLNAYGYVSNPFTKSSVFDYDKFVSDARNAQRLMDDLCDLELEKIDQIIDKVESDPEPLSHKEIELALWRKIKQTCHNGRRTGLGMTGVADMVAALGYKYGTKESNGFITSIYKELALASYASSIELAKERGSFPIWDLKKEQDHVFINRILSELPSLIVEDYKVYGRRNISNLTTAPCGSVSLLCRTSSGIEPVFALEHIRRRKINTDNADAKVDFVDELGDKWEEYVVYHRGYRNWLDINKDVDPKESPYYGATANEIDWISGVEMQGACQLWNDHAISRTQNVPKDATKEQISQMYLKAFSAGCKGFTVYRDGSRSGVLLSVGDKKEASKDKSELKRPDMLDCDIFQVRVNKCDWTIFVGLMDGEPYEIFAGLSEHILLPKSVQTGKIKKNARKTMPSRYDLIFGDGIEVRDVIKHFANENFSSVCRLLSCSLRHGTPVKYIVEQLRKDQNEGFDTFYKVLARVLKKYVKDGEKSTDRCPQCNEKNLIFAEGCSQCKSCGYSGCS